MEELRRAQGTIEEEIKSALTSQDVPRIYANGFTNVFSNSDIAVVLKCNSSPTAILNMSYTTTKSLVHQLSQIIAHFEKVSGQTVMTTDIVDKALSTTT